MTCPTCAQMCATSEEQLAIRQRNMAAMPDATPAPCPTCGSIEWATSREMIEPETPNRWWQFGTPPSWRLLAVFQAIVAALCITLAVISDNRWSEIINAVLAGLNAGWAWSSITHAKQRALFDDVVRSFREMAEINEALINNRVIMHVNEMRRDDDYPPIAPKLH